MKKKYNFRDHLWEIFEGRVQRNSAYSLQAFARDLGVSKSGLSLVMNNKRGFSVIAAEKVASKLALHFQQRNRFLDSVKSDSSRITKVREKSAANLRAKKAKSLAPRKIKTESLAFDLTWRHLALREMVSLNDFEPSPEQLSVRLSLSPAKATAIWEESLREGFVVADIANKYRASEHLSFVGHEKSKNRALKNMYKEILNTALQKVEQSEDERHLSLAFLAVTESQYQELIRLLRLFRSETSRNLKVSAALKKTSVVCWATQIFKI